jgi:NAD(P)H-flavin reductase
MIQCNCDKNTRDIYLPELATIRKRRMMNGTELYLQVEMDGTPLAYRPGQFVEVSVAGVGEVPISISSSPTQNWFFELVIRNVGNVTKKLHRMGAGDKVGIRGPFGKGYPAEEMRGRNLVFISGGIGLVPQRSFINYVLDNRSDYGDVTIIQGTKCFPMRVYREECELWAHREDVTFKETVDESHDCWTGNVGVVTTLIPKIEDKLKGAAVFVCGPPVMYKFVLMSLAEAEVPRENIFVNLERRMKCGVGKCGHCQINHHYVCQDGPVYNYAALQTAPEAI